jgi:putative ABC transport system substrate-binding protein
MQLDQLKRREFITLLGGVAGGWPPRTARAQQAEKRYTVGILSAGGAPVLRKVLFDALRELGWIEGKNVVFEQRYAENRLVRLPELAADLVRLKVDVIAVAGTLAPLAAKRATSTIPIVMTAAGDPLGSGLVASLARPRGNVTGLSIQQSDTATKRLELLREVVLGLRRLAIMGRWARMILYNIHTPRQSEVELVRSPRPATSGRTAWEEYNENDMGVCCRFGRLDRRFRQ